MPIFFNRFFCFFLFTIFSLPLYAEGSVKQYYIVEAILFKHLNGQGKQEEFWYRPEEAKDAGISTLLPPHPVEPGKEYYDVPALAEYDIQNHHFIPLRDSIYVLSPQNYKLNDAAAHLRYSPNFEVLAHFGWTQRSFSKRDALPVRITSKQFSNSLIPEGDLQLYVSRYLHIQLDLKASECVYTQRPSQLATIDDNALDKQLEDGTADLESQKVAISTNISPEENSSQQQCVNKVYHFQQNRKMRSRTLHYIDNPVFGLLVYITPFSPSASAE